MPADLRFAALTQLQGAGDRMSFLFRDARLRAKVTGLAP
jgi:hypothetical protein